MIKTIRECDACGIEEEVESRQVAIGYNTALGILDFCDDCARWYTKTVLPDLNKSHQQNLTEWLTHRRGGK